ncbi:MAG: hypothetical protein E2O95_02400 [Acidobacteria bacterium]|nr:MAG: hypothetical protein E2O95_02400 [Acidobacteriota bacterium]
MTNPSRLGVVGVFFAVLLSVLGLRLWSMQVTNANAYEERAANQQVKVVNTPAPRGDIISADGVKLAGTRSALAIVVDLALIDEDDIPALAENLAAFLDESASDIVEQLSGSNRGAQVRIATDISSSQATFILEHRDDFPGVAVIPQPVRTYPLGDLAAHVLGYIGRPNEEDLLRDDVKPNDFVGRAGVERSYDVVLQGAEGIIQYQVDARRKVLSLSAEAPPTSGNSLVLTIDSKLQAQLQDSLRDGLIQARSLEMKERDVELSETTRTQRIEDALVEARAEALEILAEELEEQTSDLGVDDNDVEPDVGPVTVDVAKVLGPLSPLLPIDSNGVCVPVQRVSIPIEGTGILSGVQQRVVRFESVRAEGDDFVATISLSGERSNVKRNGWVDEAREVLQVLHVSEDEIILLHKDRWCPVRATGVVIDPNDGSVLAMSSFPTYDPTVFVDGLSDDQWATLSTVSAFQNFAVQGQYAPASTFKVVPYVLALEESYYPIDRGSGDKVIDVAEDDSEEVQQLPLLSDTDGYFCGGEFRFPLNDGTFQTKRDWKWPGSLGVLDLHGALEASCDLYFWDLALRLWHERFDDSGIDKENLLQSWARSFGFGTSTGIDLPFERSGLIPDSTWFKDEQRKGTGRVRPDGGWVGGDLMDIAVGQGAVLVTPLQLANGFAAMVNGGTVWKPRVVSQVIDSEGNVVETNPRAIVSRVNLDERTVRLLLQDLQQVVNNQKRGTARGAFKNFGPNVELVGGKTGTGEIIKNDERFRQVDDALFVGVAPINRPKWVVSVIIERGGFGGEVAAPVARQVLQFLLNGPESVTVLAPGLAAD